MNSNVNQLDLISIYRTLDPTTAEGTFFSSEHRTFTKIDHIHSHKPSLMEFKRIGSIWSVFSDYKRSD